MSFEPSKQAELTLFLALFFLLGTVLSEQGFWDAALEKEKAVRAAKSAEEALKEARRSHLEAVEAKRLLERAKQSIIILSEENEDFSFELGSSKIPVYFRNALTSEVIPYLDKRSKDTDADTIEIVGHTDGARISKKGNLDEGLVRAFHEERLDTLDPGSNVDLGMMRALAITEVLKEAKKGGRLSGIKHFRTYSAGQMIVAGSGEIARSDDFEPNKKRRRVEIRLLNSGTQNFIQNAF